MNSNSNPLTRQEFFDLDVDRFYPVGNDTSKFGIEGLWDIPVENKKDSFGWYNGKIVALDYGS